MKLTYEQVLKFAETLEHSAINIRRYLRENKDIDLTDRDIRSELHDIAIKMNCQ